MATYAVAADISGVASEFTVPSGYSDSELNTIIEEIEDYINRLIKDDYTGSQSLTLDVNGTGNRILYTRPYTKLPIISISSITWREDTTRSFDSSNDWKSTDFVFKKYYIEATGNFSSIRASTRSYFAEGLENYRISGNFGYSTVPGPIQRATVLLVRDRIQPGYLQQFDVSEEAWDDYRIKYSATKGRVRTLTGYPAIDALLNPYINRGLFLESV